MSDNWNWPKLAHYYLMLPGHYVRPIKLLLLAFYDMWPVATQQWPNWKVTARDTLCRANGLQDPAHSSPYPGQITLWDNSSRRFSDRHANWLHFPSPQGV
ncbi:hypothetical protein VNO77_22584 [Canavalia gladiata]|uniref:Uncharacterized protein n=1 Tax=Canavalia gladiata TaxID=3824 RepID=A0AAN9L5G6_CANGL